VSPTTDLGSDTALRLERMASARAEHPASRNVVRPTPGTGPGGHLAAVKPIRPPVAPEAWSAGLWGSFA